MGTKRRNKALRVIGGMVLMLAFVGVVLFLLIRQAGEWGVPYFSFTSAHGSPCRNHLTGYTCEPLTLADVEFFGDLDLPDDTEVLSGSYRATHDYELNAQLRVPAASAVAARTELREVFGPCRDGASSPLPRKGLSKFCVLASPTGADERGEMPSRLFSVGTGLDKTGDRLIGLSIRSR